MLKSHVKKQIYKIKKKNQVFDLTRFNTYKKKVPTYQEYNPLSKQLESLYLKKMVFIYMFTFDFEAS